MRKSKQWRADLMKKSKSFLINFISNLLSTQERYENGMFLEFKTGKIEDGKEAIAIVYEPMFECCVWHHVISKDGSVSIINNDDDSKIDQGLIYKWAYLPEPDEK